MVQQSELLKSGPKTVTEVYEHIGWNKYHWALFLVCGFGWVADSIETGLLSNYKVDLPEQSWPDSKPYIWIVTWIVYVGKLIGCFIWGPLADRYGRRFSFGISNACLVSTGVIAAFAPNYPSLVVIRFLCGVSISGITVAFDALIEAVPERLHNNVGLFIEVFWTGGGFYVTLVGWATDGCGSSHHLPMEPWRVLTLAAAVPIFIASLGVFFLEESPLWLQAKGRQEEAMTVLARIASKGGKSLDGISLMAHEGACHQSMSEVFKRPFTRTTMDWSLIWMLGLCGYYGAYLAGPSVFTNDSGCIDFGEVLFGNIGEILGLIVCLIAARKWGNMPTMIGAFAAGALGMLPVLGINADNSTVLPKWILMLGILIGRGGCMGGTSIMYVGTPLSYPTRIRATAHGACNLSGCVGGMLAALFEGLLPIRLQAIVFMVMNGACVALSSIEKEAMSPHVEVENLGGSIISAKDKGASS